MSGRSTSRSSYASHKLAAVLPKGRDTRAKRHGSRKPHHEAIPCRGHLGGANIGSEETEKLGAARGPKKPEPRRRLPCRQDAESTGHFANRARAHRRTRMFGGEKLEPRHSVFSGSAESLPKGPDGGGEDLDGDEGRVGKTLRGVRRRHGLRQRVHFQRCLSQTTLGHMGQSTHVQGEDGQIHSSTGSRQSRRRSRPDKGSGLLIDRQRQSRRCE